MKLPRPVSYIERISSSLYIMLAPSEKSGAGIMDRISVSLSFIYAVVASHTSARLNEHIFDAIPTAMPWFGFTSIDGNAAGRSVGSFISPS